MATAKKRSKKPRTKAARCSRGGSEIHAKGSSPRAKRRRSQAGFELVTCRSYRPVKATRRVPKRRSEKNGTHHLTPREHEALAFFAADYGRTWKSKALNLRAHSSRFPMDWPDVYRAINKLGPSGLRAYRV